MGLLIRWFWVRAPADPPVTVSVNRERCIAEITPTSTQIAEIPKPYPNHGNFLFDSTDHRGRLREILWIAAPVVSGIAWA